MAIRVQAQQRKEFLINQKLLGKNNAKQTANADDSDEEAPETHQSTSFKDKLFIASDSKFIQFYDTYMLLIIAYSCFTSAYYVAFSFPDSNNTLLMLEHVVFGSYTIDIVLNFVRVPVLEGDSHK